MSGRIYKLDNAKFILMVLVIMGHQEPSLGLTRYLECPTFFRNFIYAFHMPFLAFISGYFSKERSFAHLLRSSTVRILLPFLVFDFFYTIVISWLNGSPNIKWSPWFPQYGMWYLLCLFYWRLISVALSSIPHPLIISLIISVVAGYIPQIGGFLSLGKCLGFLPFFVAGFCLSTDKIQIDLAPKSKYLAALTLFWGILGMFFFQHDKFNWWFAFEISYPTLGIEGKLGGVYRLATYAISFILGFAFLVLMPKRKLLFSDMGSHTLYPYLLHLPILLLISIQISQISKDSYLSQIPIHWTINLGATFLLSTVLVTTFASPPSRFVFRFLIEPHSFMKNLGAKKE